jgi:hypothetical protein
MNKDRWKPGGDKYESIKADEQWEKAHRDTNALLQGDMDTEADEPHHYLEGIVDISEVEE